MWEAVRTARSDVVVGLSWRVDGEAAIQHCAAGHVADTPVQAVSVAQIGQDLVVCGGDNISQYEECKNPDTPTALSPACTLYSCYFSIQLSAFMSQIYCGNIMWIS